MVLVRGSFQLIPSLQTSKGQQSSHSPCERNLPPGLGKPSVNEVAVCPEPLNGCKGGRLLPPYGGTAIMDRPRIPKSRRILTALNPSSMATGFKIGFVSFGALEENNNSPPHSSGPSDLSCLPKPKKDCFTPTWSPPLFGKRAFHEALP